MTQAQIISYEEYYPYGSTSYQAGRSATEVSSKRYRYTGKERDEESGLDYHGARYYAPWLGRWVSAIRLISEAASIFIVIVLDSPVTLNDLNGTGPERPKKSILKKAWDWLVAKAGRPIVIVTPLISQEPDPGPVQKALHSSPEEDEVRKHVEETKAELESESKTTLTGASPPEPELSDKRLVTASDLHANRDLGNAQAVETVGGGGGGGGGSTAAKLEDVAKAENQVSGLSKLESGTLKAGSFIEGLIPGPQDALLLEFQAFAEGYGGAREVAEAPGTERGFALGYAAALLGMSPAWIDDQSNIRFRWANSSVATDVSATTGVYERTLNNYFGLGYRYGRSQFRGARRYNDQFFNDKTIRNTALALAPAVHQLFVRAAQAREAKEREIMRSQRDGFD